MTATSGLSDQKRTYLRVLAILHYVHAALIALLGVVMLGMLFFFGGMGFWHRGMGGMGGMGGMDGMGGMGGMRSFGCLELAILVPAVLLVVGYAALNFLVGRWLEQRRRWTAIVVVSALNALNVPVGTLLGVFTIVVLLGDDVRVVFEGQAPLSSGEEAPR